MLINQWEPHVFGSNSIGWPLKMIVSHRNPATMSISVAHCYTIAVEIIVVGWNLVVMFTFVESIKHQRLFTV